MNISLWGLWFESWLPFSMKGVISVDNIQEYILKSIDILLEQKINNLKFDKTYDGKIIEATDGGYTVGVAGKKINVTTDSTYSAGDVVLVHLPRNNWNNAYLD